jgi:hypothetical protein
MQEISVANARIGKRFLNDIHAIIKRILKENPKHKIRIHKFKDS